jgi:hypothetical protein
MMSAEEQRDDVLQNVMLVSPNMGVWRGNYMLPQTHVQITYSDKELDQDSITAPQTKLINERFPVDRAGKLWIKRFREIKQAQIHLLNKYSVGSGITGVKIIPKSAGLEFFPRLIGPTVGELMELKEEAEKDGDSFRQLSLHARLEQAKATTSRFVAETPVFDPTQDRQSIAYELHMMAEEFCDQMDDVYDQIRSNESLEVWEAVRDRMPKTREEMRGKFYCGTIPIEFATGGSTDRVRVTHKELARYQSVVSASVRTAVDEAIENMIAQPRAELAKAITNMTELISRDGKVSVRTFNPVQRAIQKLRLFSFVGNDEMLKQINQLERMMDAQVPKELNNAVANSSGFMQAAKSVMEELESAVTAEENFRKFGSRRVVSL